VSGLTRFTPRLANALVTIAVHEAVAGQPMPYASTGPAPTKGIPTRCILQPSVAKALHAGGLAVLSQRDGRHFISLTRLGQSFAQHEQNLRVADATAALKGQKP